MRNYLYEMLDALTSAYSRKDYNNRHNEFPLETSIGKLFAILAWGLDSVHEQAELIKMCDDLDNARGSALARYGANFGVKRVSPDDRYYRLAIKVKVMAQLSGGDVDTVIWATAALLEVDPSEVLLEEVYPAKIALYVDQNILSQEKLDMIFQFADAIKRIMAAGVGLRLYLRTYRAYRNDLIVKRFGIMNSHTFSSPPSTNQFYTRYQNGFRGVYYSTHIKPKRID